MENVSVNRAKALLHGGTAASRLDGVHPRTQISLVLAAFAAFTMCGRATCWVLSKTESLFCERIAGSLA